MPPVEPTRESPDPAVVLTAIKNWKEIVVIVAGALAAVIGQLGEGKLLEPISFVLSAVLVIGGSLVWVLRRRRQKDKKNEEHAYKEWLANTKQKSAFRGLSAYREGDILPGEHRQREARRLFTVVSDFQFKFGILCGDSGCGKTSILDSTIQRLLKDSGSVVAFVRSPSQVLQKSPSSRIRDKFQVLADLFTQQMSSSQATGPRVLIIDQFEELLIEFPHERQRRQLGNLLRTLLEPPVSCKLLIAIRKDYLVDLENLAFGPGLYSHLFYLKGFSPQEATNVILECSAHDGLPVNRDLARQVAKDLASGGIIRPTELQIVCTALTGQFTLASYRLAGGATGILADYIETSVAKTSPAVLGKLILRHLCNIPAQAKKDPQTITQIVAALSSHPGATEDSVRTVLRQFETERLIVCENQESGTEAWRLIHDYLVEPVTLATGAVATKAEIAEQQLEYHLSSFHRDPDERIPFGRLRSIKHNINPERLNDPEVQKLIRASAIAFGGRMLSLGGIVLILTLALVGTLNYRTYWIPEDLGKHPIRWGGNPFERHFNDRSEIRTSALLTGLSDSVLILAVEGKPTELQVWDAVAGELIYSRTHGHFMYAPSGDFVVMRDSGGGSTHVYDIRKRSEFSLPIPWDRQLTFVDSSDILIASDKDSVMDAWSLRSRKRLGSTSLIKFSEIATVMQWSADQLLLTAGGADTMVVVPVPEGGDTTFAFETVEEAGRRSTVYFYVWDLPTGRLLPLSEKKFSKYVDISTGYLDVRYLYWIEGFSDRMTISKWERRSRSLVDSISYNMPYGTWPNQIDISEDRSRIIISRWGGLTRRDSIVLVLNSSTLEQLDVVPPGTQYVPANGYLFGIIAREQSNGIFRDLNVRGAQPVRLPLFFQLPLLDVTLHPRSRFGVVRRNSGEHEVWDFRSGNLVERLANSSLVRQATFMDKEHLAVSLVSGNVQVYSLPNVALIAELEEVGESAAKLVFTPECERFHVWTGDGRVLRYVRVRKILFWELPTRRCTMDKNVSR